jgi:hypothetical protein
MRKNSLLIIGLLAVLAVVVTLVLAAPSFAGKLEEAIAKTPQGVGKGMIDPSATPGFMGIPGAPHHFWLFYILWGIWVGWIFSSVGAFGGIMAGVGHITVFGLADYGRTFKSQAPLNKLLTDSSGVQPVPGGAVTFISSVTYYRMGRWVPWGSAWPSAASGGLSHRCSRG